MGTRSSYLITEKFGKKVRKIANVYFQYDGYPSGHPKDLCEWISKSQVVNGYSEVSENIFNGVGCFAAQFVAKFKDKTGNVYLESFDNYGKCGEDYLYEINFIEYNLVEIVAKDYNKKELFRGTAEQFLEWA
jgi:hypothetical protein